MLIAGHPYNDFEPHRTIDKLSLQTVDEVREYYPSRGGNCTTRVDAFRIELQKQGVKPIIISCQDPKGSTHLALYFEFSGSSMQGFTDYPDKCLFFYDPGLHYHFGHIIYFCPSPEFYRGQTSTIYTEKHMYHLILNKEEKTLTVLARDAKAPQGKTFSPAPQRSVYKMVEVTDDELFGLMKSAEQKKRGKIQTQHAIYEIKAGSLQITSPHFIQGKKPESHDEYVAVKSWIETTEGRDFLEYLESLLKECEFPYLS